jgi:hypothetical protein
MIGETSTGVVILSTVIMIEDTGTTGSGWIANNGEIVMAAAVLKNGEDLKVALLPVADPNVTVGKGNKIESQGADFSSLFYCFVHFDQNKIRVCSIISSSDRSMFDWIMLIGALAWLQAFHFHAIINLTSQYEYPAYSRVSHFVKFASSLERTQL